MSNWHARLYGVQGHFVVPITFGRPNVINSDSQVFASITEVGGLGQIPEHPFIGAASSMSIKNVCPQDNNTVLLAVDTNWTGGPINVRVSLCINPSG